MNDGEASMAKRTDSATSLEVPFGVRLLKRRKLVTSASVSGRRNALRPNALMVSVKHVAWVASAHVMNLDLLVALAITSVAIFSAALR